MRKLLVLTLLAGMGVLRAQNENIRVEWKEEQKWADTFFKDIVGSSEDFFYTKGQRYSGQPVSYYRYDLLSGDMLEKVVFPYGKYEGGSLYIEKVYNVGDDLHYILKSYSKESDRRVLLFTKVDKRGEFSPLVELASLDGEDSDKGQILFDRSKDKSKLLMFTHPPEEKKKGEKFIVKVVSSDYEVEWEKEVELPYRDKYFVFQDQAITNNGDVIILGYALADRKNGDKVNIFKPTAKFMAFKISRSGDIKVYNINLAGKYVNSAELKPDFGEDGAIAITGFYSDKGNDWLAGHFFITLDQEEFVEDVAHDEPLSQEFLETFMSSKSSKEDVELKYFNFTDFIEKGNGGAILVAERAYMKSSTDDRGKVSYKYFRDGIIVVSINPDGTEDWSTFINKGQKSASSELEGISYLLKVDGDKLHFIFNDGRRNTKRRAEGKSPDRVYILRKGIVTVATVHNGGEVTYGELMNNKENGVVFLPETSVELEDGSILFGTRWNSKIRFGIIRF